MPFEPAEITAHTPASRTLQTPRHMGKPPAHRRDGRIRTSRWAPPPVPGFLASRPASQHDLPSHRHLTSGAQAEHYCSVPEGQPPTVTWPIRGAGLQSLSHPPWARGLAHCKPGWTCTPLADGRQPRDHRADWAWPAASPADAAAVTESQHISVGTSLASAISPILCGWWSEGSRSTTEHRSSILSGAIDGYRSGREPFCGACMTQVS